MDTYWASLVRQLVKSLPVMQETPVRFLGQEALLEKGKQYSLASLVAQTVKNPPQEAWVPSLGREDPWRREKLSTSVLWPGEFHGQRSLAGYSSPCTWLSDFEIKKRQKPDTYYHTDGS